jgi:DNA-binding NarL/FixJ family response regulator
MKKPSGTRFAVFVVDDHPLVREGLELVLGQEGFEIVGEAAGIASTLEHPRLASSQVVLIDLSLDRMPGLDLIPELRRRGLLVVVYSMHEDPAIVRRALAAGASGYVTKREGANALAEAIRTAAAGGVYVSPRAAAASA